MGKINRFYSPVQQQYVSQFIPENLQLMQNALNVRQNQYDTTQKQLDLYNDELLNQQALQGQDTKVLKGIRSDYDKFNADLLGKDLGDPKVAREVGKFIRDYKRDPRIQKLNQGLETKKRYDELTAKYKGDKDGLQYAIENDPMAKAWQTYLEKGEQEGKFAIDYIGGLDTYQAGVNIDKTMESMFDNMSDQGWDSLKSIGEDDIETWYKNSFTGKTPKFIESMANRQHDRFMDTPAGQQLERKLKYYNPNATNQEIENEIKRQLFTVGMERVKQVNRSGEAGALNSAKKKQKEKELLDAKAMLSVGNTSLSNIGVEGFENIDNKPMDPVIAGVKVASNVLMDFIGEMSKSDNERFNGGTEEDWLSNNIKTNAEKVRNVTQISEEDKKRFKTTAINFKNTLSDEQLEGFNKLSKEEKGKKLKEYIELMPKTSLELQGEVPLDPKRKALLNELVTFNSAANAPVTPLDGESPDNQPTLDSYREAGYKIVGRYVMKSNPVKPGERLAIVMEDDNGNRARVSTKGALVLGENVNEIIPSERNSYVADKLQRQKFNYESSEFVIPIDSREYAQTSYMEDSEPQGGSIKGNIDNDSYNISINAFGKTFSAKWYFNEGKPPYTKSDGNKAYAKYKEALDEISKIYDTNEPDATKAANVVSFIENLSKNQ